MSSRIDAYGFGGLCAMLERLAVRSVRPLRTLAARVSGRSIDRVACGLDRLYWCEGFGRSPRRVARLLADGFGPFADNFGDALSPLVVSLISGRPVTYATGPRKLMAIGSTFFALQDDDVVWGAGMARAGDERFATACRRLRFAAVRGPATRDRLKRRGFCCSDVTGDPAVLLPLLVANDLAVTHDVGIIPHWTQVRTFAKLTRDPLIRLIDVRRPVHTVMRQLLSCRIILSTSLHGVIVAEAYGIPALLVVLKRPESGMWLKFDDYFWSTDRETPMRVISRPDEIGRLADHALRVPQPRLERRRLWDAFPLTPARPFPTSAATGWGGCRLPTPA